MDNRQNIIDATDRLLQTHGLARLTTREIAREAKVAEGLIYHHFKDKAELIFEVVETRVRESKDIMQNLPLEVGKSTLIKNLEDVLLSIYHAHYEISPIKNYMFACRKSWKNGIWDRNMPSMDWMCIWLRNSGWGGFRMQLTPGPLPSVCG